MASLTQQTNNPFALIQKYGKPSPWKGLKGQRESGFLVFDTVENGLRAGFINLYNTYFKRGRNTIATIIPVYAPEKDKRKVEAYIRFLENYTKWDRNKVISIPTETLLLGRGIIHFEAGQAWIPEREIQQAHSVALQYLGLEAKAQKAAYTGGAVLVAAISYWIYRLIVR